MYTMCLAWTCMLCAGGLGSAEAFQVNTRTAGKQCNAAITAEANGRFAVAWSSYFSGGGRSNEIIARRFAADGRPVGAEFQVNATSAGNQTEPAIANGAPGLLLVVWQGPGSDGDEDIFARIFDANSEPITSDFQVNTETAGRQLYPSVAGCDEGTFVVIWESRQPGEATSIQGRLYDGLGVALGEAFSIAYSTRDSRYPDVAMDGMGGFAVAWMEDRSSNRIVARAFDGKGTALSGPLAVNAAGIASVTRPSVAMRADGGFVVVWDGDPRLASLDDIHARCYGFGGVPESDPFLVNVQAEGRQQLARVAMEATGRFIVVWQHEHDDPDLATDILARRFDRGGLPAGAEFRVNDYVDGKQRDADVIVFDHGTVVVAWESEGEDGSGYGVFASIEAVADLHGDGVVDFRDFCLLGWSWRDWQSEFPDDGRVKAGELEAFCRYWLK